MLYTFTGGADGAQPYSGLIRDSAGNLYGTTVFGGTGGAYPHAGTVFRVSPAGKETVLHNFTGGADGGFPTASLIRDSKGNLYGTTVGGGSHNDGTVFKVDSTGHETVIHSFAGTDGAQPEAGLLHRNGYFYGTTAGGGGQCQCGTVFKVTASGGETVLHKFTGQSDGLYPYSGLAADTSGNLYGTTRGGSPSCSGVYCGTIFKVTP